MKLVTVFSTTALAVLLGMSVPVYAQQDESHPQEEKRAEPDGKAAHEQERQDNNRVDQGKDRPGDRRAEKAHVRSLDLPAVQAAGVPLGTEDDGSTTDED